MTDTGTSSLGLTFAQMPAGAEFHNQTLRASIGWATPAAFGAAVGAPGRRIVLVTGEGSHQMTAQEIGQFGWRGLRPIVFVLNNSGYLSERMLCKDEAIAYNEHRRLELRGGSSCDGLRGLVHRPCRHLRRARQGAEGGRAGRRRRVHRSRHRRLEAPPMYKKLHENIESFYNVT
ncbi:thiamine pyrophosphate-dependent enzyme [Prescottella defluvii]|nr:thiamine pyrophosphate-dependent enzyme [Prescottella defluvii]